MNRSILLASACALAACFAVSSAHAHDHTPARVDAFKAHIDARILSAAPFEFRADSAIFSPMTGEPSDSRIFMQPKAAPRAGETSTLSARFQARTRA
jgi:hypothetical protein